MGSGIYSIRSAVLPSVIEPMHVYNPNLNINSKSMENTVYWETLTKGKFDDFDESCQTKTVQYFSF